MFRPIVLGSLAAVGVALPAVAQDQIFKGDICGNSVNVQLKAPGPDANPELKKFWGVWGKGKWDSGLCTGLIVAEVTPTSATVEYYWGSAPGMEGPGTFEKKDAKMKGKYLHFTSLKGYDITYEPSGAELKGWFGNATLSDKLKKLQ